MYYYDEVFDLYFYSKCLDLNNFGRKGAIILMTFILKSFPERTVC